MAVCISLIAAIGKNGELGAGNDLLWHLPKDFAWFVNKTKGHVIIMGRKTMEALNKPLKDRRNIVISRNADKILPGFEHVLSLNQAMEEAAKTELEEIFIIGGGEIYKQSMHFANKLYITNVDGTFPDADTHFPEIGPEWKKTFGEFHPVDEKHAHSFELTILEK